MGNFKSDGKAIFAIFIGVMIAAVFLATISDSVFTQTTTLDLINQTITSGAVNVTVDIEGREALVLTEAYNLSGDSCILLGCAIQTGFGSSGLQSAQFVVNDTVDASFVSASVNLSYSANPNGYLSDGASRSVSNLVVLFGALAILITVIVILWSGTLGDLVRGNR